MCIVLRSLSSFKTTFQHKNYSLYLIDGIYANECVTISHDASSYYTNADSQTEYACVAEQHFQLTHQNIRHYLACFHKLDDSLIQISFQAFYFLAEFFKQILAVALEAQTTLFTSAWAGAAFSRAAAAKAAKVTRAAFCCFGACKHERIRTVNAKVHTWGKVLAAPKIVMKHNSEVQRSRHRPLDHINTPHNI